MQSYAKPYIKISFPNDLFCKKNVDESVIFKYKYIDDGTFDLTKGLSSAQKEVFDAMSGWPIQAPIHVFLSAPVPLDLSIPFLMSLHSTRCNLQRHLTKYFFTIPLMLA